MKHTRLWLATIAVLWCNLAASAHDFEMDGIYYNITSSTDLTVEVTYKGSTSSWYINEYAGEITIPETVTYKDNTYQVTSIGTEAFYDCSTLTSISISKSVSTIKKYAFASCKGLSAVTIPENVALIEDNAFNGCTSLKEVIISDSHDILSVGLSGSDGLFDDCPLEQIYMGRNLDYRLSKKTSPPFSNKELLTKVVIGNYVTQIGEYAFWQCTNLTAIHLPESVTSIGRGAFSNCSSLASILFSDNIISIGSDVFLGSAWFDNLPDGEIYVGKIFYKYKGVMPENTSIEIKEGTVSIGYEAFYGCNNLSSIVIPESVTSIGIRAFYGCCNLSSITLPNRITEIAYETFSGCSNLTSITIPENVTQIRDYAFYNCVNLYKIVNYSSLPLSVGTTQHGYVAYYAKIALVGNTLSSIGDFQFSTIDNTHYLVNYFGKDTDIVLPNSYNGENYKIEQFAFYNCGTLTSIYIPVGVVSIGDKAFYNCSNLTSISLPESIVSIGNMVFSGCTGELVVHCNIPSVSASNYGTFYNSKFTKVIVNKNVTSIGDRSFDDCFSLKEVIIEDGGETLSLGENYISYSSSSIGQGLFYDCPLEKVYLGRNLDYSCSGSCGYSPFYNSESSPSISLGDSITRIRSYLYYNNKELSSITIPQNVTEIGGSAFDGCDSLTEVYFEDGEQILSLGYNEYNYNGYGEGLFYDYKQLRKVHIGRELDFNTDKKYGYSPFYKMNIDTLIISKKQSKDLRLGGINKQATLLYMDNDYSKVLPVGLQENCTLHYFNAPYSSSNHKDVAGYLKNELKCNAQMVPLGNISAGFYSLEVTLNDTLLKHEVRGRVPVTTGPNRKPILRRYVKINGDTITANAAGVYKCENLEMDTDYNVELIYNGYRDNLYKRYTTSTAVSTKKFEPTCNVSATLSTATIRYNMGDTIGFGKPISEIGVHFYGNGTHYPADGKDEWLNLPYHTTIKDLRPGSSYSYQIYLKTDTNYYYSEYQHFNMKYPTIKLVENKKSTQTTATLKVIGEYKDNNISPIEIGVMLDYKSYWGGYQHSGQYIADSDGNVLITGLKPNTTYAMTPYIKYFEDDFYPTTGTILTITTDSVSIACDCVATSATTLTVKGTHDAGDATVIEYGFRDHAANMDQITLTGLDPNDTYTFTYYVTTAEGGTVHKTITATTEELTFNTLKAKATSHTRAIICAKSNIANEESGTGFEWRRIDAPDLVPSEFAGCAVHDGMMEGILENLSANTYYKYRPFYTSASGQSYYGEWIGFGTADAYVYFAPTVHTYTTATKNTNIVCLTGYVLPGSDDIVEQGFEYWKDETSTRSGNNVTKVLANGQRMSVLIENLEYGTRYKYRAFVTTTKETVFGEIQMFETPIQTDVEEITYDKPIVISSDEGVIYINNVEENCRVRIFTLSGVEIYTGYDREISVESGIYIIHINNIIQKLMVK